MKLEAAEAELLAADVAAFAEAVADPQAQARFRRLAEEAARGEVPDELVGWLETLLELVFEKGRPSNRAVLQSIYARTPRGRQQRAAAHEVNAALRALRGQRVEQVHISTGPSRHTLTLETDRCKLTLELDSAGSRVASLETGG